MNHSSFEVTTGIIKIKISCVSELSWKFPSYKLPVLNPHRPKDQQHSLHILSHCILVFYAFFATIFPSKHFPFLYPAKHLTTAVPKINHSYKDTDLVQSFGFYALHQEELFAVYASNSEADPWNILLNSLEKPMERINRLYTAAVHMLNGAEFTPVVPQAINCTIKNKLWLLQEAQLPPLLQAVLSTAREQWHNLFFLLCKLHGHSFCVRVRKTHAHFLGGSFPPWLGWGR